MRNRNEIVGLIGNCIEKILIKKWLRKCRIKGYNYFGTKLDNGTWTGIMGEILIDKFEF